jgi:hypothetical protein
VDAHTGYNQAPTDNLDQALCAGEKQP